MVYLDYLLYIIILILFYILMNKIIQNENPHLVKQYKEGFEHKGKGFIAGKSKKTEAEEAEKPDSQWIITIKTFYRIAADVAIILIKMPYKFLSQGVNMIIEFIQNINEMLKPMYDFIRQMGRIAVRIAKQFYAIFSKIFKQVFNILRNMPAFIKQYATIAINFISTMVEQTINMLTSFFNLFQNILNKILEIPQKFFDIMNQFSTLFFNMFNMLIDLPEKGLNMVIGFQETIMKMMDRPLKVPFADQFLGDSPPPE